MRRVIAIILFILFSSSLSAQAANSGERMARPEVKSKSGSQARNEQVFRAIYGDPPQSLDPHALPDPAAWPIILASYQRLMSFESGTAKPTPSIVAGMAVSPDGLQYTFQLREGQTFSDGTVLNTEAVYYSFDRLMASEVGGLYYPYLKSFKPNGTYSFTLILKRPWPPFLASLALPQASIISPGLRNKTEGYLRDKTLGSGYYMVYDWQDNTIGLTVRPDLAARPNLSFAMFHYEPDPRRRYEKMVAHEAHLTIDPALPAEGLSPQFQFLEVPTFGVRFLAINTRQPYTRLQNTRRALAFIVKDAFKEHPRALNNLFPPGLFYNAPASMSLLSVSNANHLVQAGMILKDVGLPAHPLVLAVEGRGEELEADARKVSEALTAHGFNINIIRLNGPEGRKILESGAYDLYLGSRYPDIPAADMWLGRFLSSQSSPEGNPAFFRSSRADQMILEIMDTIGQSGDGPHDYYLRHIAMERAAKLADLAALADNEAPYVFLYQLGQPLVADVRLVPNETGGNSSPHPVWPQVWPIDVLNLKPYSHRSGVNPTGRKPEAPPQAQTPSPAGPAAAVSPQTPPAAAPPSVQGVPGPSEPPAGSLSERPAGPNPNPTFDEFIGSELE